MFRCTTNCKYLWFSLFWVILILSPVDTSAQKINSHLTNSIIERYQKEDSLKAGKSPRNAMIRSLFVPGWGQLYNGKKIKSLIIFGVETSVISAIFVQNNRLSDSKTSENRSFYRDERNKFIWWFGGVIIYSVLDAYVDAYLQGFSVDMDINKEIGSAATVRLNISVPF